MNLLPYNPLPKPQLIHVAKRTWADVETEALELSILLGLDRAHAYRLVREMDKRETLVEVVHG